MICPRCGVLIEDRMARHFDLNGRTCNYTDPFPYSPEDRPACVDPSHAPCTDCSGEILVGAESTISMPRVDEDGFPLVDHETGEIFKVSLPLPVHVNPHRHSTFIPAVRE